jgi:hypothetical protein
MRETGQFLMRVDNFPAACGFHHHFLNLELQKISSSMHHVIRLSSSSSSCFLVNSRGMVGLDFFFFKAFLENPRSNFTERTLHYQFRKLPMAWNKLRIQLGWSIDDINTLALPLFGLCPLRNPFLGGIMNLGK